MNTQNQETLLGILGGLGPMSSVYFCEMLTAHTKADCDGDHVNFLLSSRADTPDRSSFILGKSPSDPTPVMTAEAKRLEMAGATVIAIPCNTAHYFYKRICAAVNVPIINIIEETAKLCEHGGFSKVGVLATEGTIASGAYANVFSPRKIEIVPLDNKEQALISKIIFEQIKSGLEPDIDSFLELCEKLRARGCERLILGCTELSLIKKNFKLPDYFIDSLEVLALSAIQACNKQPKDFDSLLMNFYGDAEKGKTLCF